MRILFLGDIVGRPGREICAELIQSLRVTEKLDFVIANSENAAAGSGLTPKIADQLLETGIDVLTSGDHIWKKRDIYDYLKVSRQLIRPLNYPKSVFGRGSTVIDLPNGKKIGVINLIGRVFMDHLDSPFERIKDELEEVKRSTDIIIVDFHAEATSEKVAMGWYLDGKVSAVLGTHTHIQTSDDKILPQGTAYITDCGMTGPYDSVIGREKERILEHFVTQLPIRFEMASGDVQLHGVIIEVNDETGKAISIKRVQMKEGD